MARPMGLAPGAQLGPYEIRSQLGQGGMGVVYLAQDPRLERQVAIKVVPLGPQLSCQLRSRGYGHGGIEQYY